MALPKFIITMDGVFRLGMVNQHKDLLKCLIPRKGVNRKLALDLLFHLTYYKANCSSSRNGQGINAQPSLHRISGGQS